jgi:phosphohistidine phosphatase
MLAVLHSVNETVRSVLLIGHNPGMHDLAVKLAGAHGGSDPDTVAGRVARGFPTGALAEFAIAGPWQLLDAGGSRLVRFLAPRDLRNGEASGAST